MNNISFDEFLYRMFYPFQRDVCSFINKICKKVDECLGISRIAGNVDLVLNQKGEWISPPIPQEVIRWEYIEIPYTLFTANATTETVTFYTMQPKQSIIAVLLNTKEVFNNVSSFSITQVTAGGANQFTPTPALNCLTSLTTASISNNGNLRMPSLTTTTSLQITATSTGGNVNAPTQGKINCWLLTSNLP